MTLVEGVRIRTGQELQGESDVLLKNAAVQVSMLLGGDKQLKERTAEDLWSNPEDSLYATFQDEPIFLGHMSISQAMYQDVSVEDGQDESFLSAIHFEFGSFVVASSTRGHGIGSKIAGFGLCKLIGEQMEQTAPGELRVVIVSALANAESRRVFTKLGMNPGADSTDLFTRHLRYDLSANPHYAKRLDESGNFSGGKKIVNRPFLLSSPLSKLD